MGRIDPKPGEPTVKCPRCGMEWRIFWIKSGFPRIKGPVWDVNTKVVLVQTPAEGFTPSSIEASAITGEASKGSPQTTAAAAEPQFTFYETLTKVTPETITPVEKTVSPVEKSKLPPADVMGGKFSIQLSSSTDKNSSKRKVDELKKKGYPAFLEEADLKEKGIWYRVKVGHFASRDEATKYAISMRKKEKFPNFVVVSGE
jgi:cell division septation protein DedD